MQNRLKELRHEKNLTLKEVSSQLEQNNFKISPDALANKTESLVSFAFPLIDDLEHLIRSEFRHVERVNAKLVIE